MADFITLTALNGNKRRFNVSQIVTYAPNDKGSSIITAEHHDDGHTSERLVTETPEQIDAMLVMQSTNSDALEALSQLVRLIHAVGLDNLEARGKPLHGTAWYIKAYGVLGWATEILLKSGAGA